MFKDTIADNFTTRDIHDNIAMDHAMAVVDNWFGDPLATCERSEEECLTWFGHNLNGVPVAH